MESYRNIWNNFFNYLKEHWKVKNFELITSVHIAAYMEYKTDYYPSKQYLQKISAALGKLELALTLFAKNTYNETREYNFSIRQTILDESRDLNLIADNYHNRAYKKPHVLIKNLKNENHKLAATIQIEGGARLEGVALIKKEQLLGYEFDHIIKKERGIIFTKEKGGKEGAVFIHEQTYKRLELEISNNGKFKINRQAYSTDIRLTCEKLNIEADGSHGFRWNFAQRRLFEYAKAGGTYEQSLLGVSHEMKHNRASITEHYIG